MRGVTLSAWRSRVEPLYLAELLLALGRPVVDLRWRLSDIEALYCPEIERCDEEGRVLGTLELLRVCTPDVQLIEGELFGHRDLADPPLVLIRAVDSSSWDVGSNDDLLVSRLLEIFPDAEEQDPRLFEASTS